MCAHNEQNVACEKSINEIGDFHQLAAVVVRSCPTRFPIHEKHVLSGRAREESLRLLWNVAQCGTKSMNLRAIESLQKAY